MKLITHRHSPSALLFFSFFLLVTFSASPLFAREADNEPGGQQASAAIASAHPLATQAGLDILRRGGNAFDAAIAVTAALAVVEPYSSGIGGGGFYLLHEAEKNRYTMLDARERAPFRAHRDMYLDDKGEVIKNASITGPLSAGIPGIPAALVHLAENYGRLALAQSLAPAISYARQGFPVDEFYQRMARFRLDDLRKDEEASRIFLQQGEVPELGYKIIQQDLAKTLEKIAVEGFAGFYENNAWFMAKEVRKNGGIWTVRDLGDYKVVEREPEVLVYKGMKLVSSTLPSSGGVVLTEVLGILSEFKLEKMDRAHRIHVIVEAMRRAYRDRAEYMGDPDYVEVPVDFLISELNFKQLAGSIDLNEATLSASLKAVARPDGNGSDTTHFSIVDPDGNKVSATLSINYPFGSCYVPKGTGVLLNDEMDDFVAKPGVPNVYGLVGSSANAIEPGKRMLSSMTPTIAETRDRVAIIGTPGGSRIISMVLLGVLDFYENKSADEIVGNGRFHHQYLPDKIFYEPGALSADVIEELQLMGHQLQDTGGDYGNMQLVIINKKTGALEAASDRRGIGSAQVLAGKDFSVHE